jgi:flagellar biosynthesis component FlhA
LFLYFFVTNKINEIKYYFKFIHISNLLLELFNLQLKFKKKKKKKKEKKKNEKKKEKKSEKKSEKKRKQSDILLKFKIKSIIFFI